MCPDRGTGLFANTDDALKERWVRQEASASPKPAAGVWADTHDLQHWIVQRCTYIWHSLRDCAGVEHARVALSLYSSRFRLYRRRLAESDIDSINGESRGYIVYPCGAPKIPA